MGADACTHRQYTRVRAVHLSALTVKKSTMKKLFKTKDGSVFADVTAKAQDILKSELFDLYVMWEKDEHTYKLPIFYPEDIETAIKYGKHICIEVSDEKHVRELFKI